MAGRISDLKNKTGLSGGGSERSSYLELILFILGIALISGAYGYAAAMNKWFPTRYVYKAIEGLDGVAEAVGLKQPWYYVTVGDVPAVKTYQPGKMSPGLTLVSGLGTENHPEARVIDSAGHVIQRWSINWFELWPDATHIPAHLDYKGLPGPHTHGVILAKNGDLIFNLERAGLFRLDPCGHVRWKLPHMTHHSLFQDEDGNLWVPDVVRGEMHDPKLPGYKGGTSDYRLLKISPDGKIIRQWRVFDLFLKNDLKSYLFVTSQDNDNAHMSGDTLHLNDAEVFPRSLPAGTFRPGDVMISLRNINMVMIFDPETETVRHMFNGPFIRQHDPDFVDGNTVSVFDNYSQTQDTEQERSRIVRVFTDGRRPEIVYEGNSRHQFFTNIMGKHQALLNGDLLLTEATKGRAIEIDPNGNMVWEYRNFVRDGVVGLMDEAQRLDPSQNAAFFEKARAACSG